MTPWSSPHEGGHNDSSFCGECKPTPIMDWADSQHSLSEGVHKLTSMRQRRLTDLNKIQDNVTMTPWSSSHEGGHNDSSFCEECKLTPLVDWADNQHNLSEGVYKLTSMRQRRLTDLNEAQDNVTMTTWSSSHEGGHNDSSLCEECKLTPLMNWADNQHNLSEGVYKLTSMRRCMVCHFHMATKVHQLWAFEGY